MKKKIDLEEHVKSQRLMFDSDRPAEGHEERFLQRLQARPVKRITFRHAIQVAASVAIILTSAMVLIRLDGNGEKMAGGEIPESIHETRAYYATEVKARYEEIRGFRFVNREEKTVLLDELKDLDAYHQQLVDDLRANPGDERVISALIRHYQIKLDIMDQIINQLEQLQTETTSNHEETSL